MAKRYDQKKKDEVVSFIQNYNKEHGRGGQSAAAKKWKLNPITVKSWMDKAGVASPGKTATKTKGRKAVGRKKSPVTKSVSATLKRMVKIQEQVESLQGEYNALKNSL